MIDLSNLDLPEVKFTSTDKHQALIDRIYKSKFQFMGLSLDNANIEERTHDAFKYVNQAVIEKKKISILEIHKIHSLLGQDGQYRKMSSIGETVWVNKYYIPADPEHLESLMNKFILRYACIDQSAETLQEICAAYFVFGLIHPFVDANGRTGRLICAWLMLQYGFGFLTPYLEKQWGNENENHAKAFKSQINNYLAWLSHPDYLNRFFSDFYLYFLEEIVSISEQIEMTEK